MNGHFTIYNHVQNVKKLQEIVGLLRTPGKDVHGRLFSSDARLLLLGCPNCELLSVCSLIYEKMHGWIQFTLCTNEIHSVCSVDFKLFVGAHVEKICQCKFNLKFAAILVDTVPLSSSGTRSQATSGRRLY